MLLLDFLTSNLTRPSNAHFVVLNHTRWSVTALWLVSGRTFSRSLLLAYSGVTKDRKRSVNPKQLSATEFRELCRLTRGDFPSLTAFLQSLQKETGSTIAPPQYRQFFSELARCSPGNFYWPQSCQKWQLCVAWPKWPKMAIFTDLKVAKNGNYLPHGRSGQKWQFLLTSKLPQMATTCFMTEVAKNGNK